jgi:hypothetical protein
MKIILIYIVFLSQLLSDWNATPILEDMDKSWSFGNGCFEANYKVVDVYGDLELNGNTLEVLDATIQVYGCVKNFGEYVDVLNSEYIIYKCETSRIIEYQTLSTPEVEVEEKIRLYPNPTSYKINIKGTFDYYNIYNINGKLVAKGIDNVIDVNFLQNGLYFVLLIKENRKQILKFIKK